MVTCAPLNEFPVPPLDSAQDIRGEMLAAMADMGVTVEKHHHEVASGQHELGIKFAPKSFGDRNKFLILVAQRFEIWRTLEFVSHSSFH